MNRTEKQIKNTQNVTVFPDQTISLNTNTMLPHTQGVIMVNMILKKRKKEKKSLLPFGLITCHTGKFLYCISRD